MDQASINNDDSGNILDVLAIIVESWWLLIGLPIVFAAIAFGMMYLTPVRHQATARVAVVTNDPALLCISTRMREGTTRGVSCTTDLAGLVTLDGVDTGGATPVITIENKDRGPLLSVTVTGAEAGSAERGVRAVVTALRSFEPEVLNNYDRMIALRQNEIERLGETINAMQGAIAAAGTATDNGLRPDGAADALVLVNETLTERQLELLNLRAYAAQAASLASMTPVVEVVPVPRDRRPVIAAFLVGAILAVVSVYLRHVLGLARAAPDYAEKRDRILRAIPFWRQKVGRPDDK